VDFGFFGTGGTGMVSAVDNPIAFDTRDSFSSKRPGWYEAYFFGQGRLISLEGSGAWGSQTAKRTLITSPSWMT
jgi:hypothetical protein